jgi:hypothetical protein
MPRNQEPTGKKTAGIMARRGKSGNKVAKVAKSGKSGNKVAKVAKEWQKWH